LRLAVSTPDQQLSYLRPRVTLSSGASVVAPHSSQTVISRVLLDCHNLQTIRPTVTVLAPDGSAHRLQVQDDGSGTVLPTPADLCDQLDADQPAVDVELGGTLASPTLQLTNTTSRPMTVNWDYEVGSGGFSPDRRDVQLLSTPALPLTLQPHQQRRAALRVVVHGCGADKPIADYSSLGFMNLSVHVSDGIQSDADAQQPVSGVDLTAIVGAALQRSCS
jgi:hypothetical protein